MRFAFEPEQRALARAIAELLEKRCTTRYLRAPERTDDLWRALCEVGVVGMLAAVPSGGLGLTEIDLVLALEEAGRAALPDPLGEVAAAAVPALRFHPEIAGIVTGERRVAVALDGVAADADLADLALVEREGGVWISADVDAVRVQSLDPSLRMFRVITTGGARIAAAPEDVRTRCAFAAAAQLLGVSTRLLEMSASYATARHQFGAPIGSFQAVKHHLANALLRLEFARPVVYNAAHSLARALPTAHRDVSMAKAFASDAATFTARIALQVHGAIGYTEESDLHLWMKRAWMLAASWGTADEHRMRVADAVLG